MPTTDPLNQTEDNLIGIGHSYLHRPRLIGSFISKANAKRTKVEILADALTAKFGSMTFLILNVVWFFSWITINLGFIPGLKIFDPFPFGLLTTIVSLEAIFLAIVVLISQNRSSKIADLREEVDLQINKISEAEITKVIELQLLLLQKNGIDVSEDEVLKRMLRPIDTNKIEKGLEKQN